MNEELLKQKKLRYAQLVFRKQKGDVSLSAEEEVELDALLAEIGLPHEVIMADVTENLLKKCNCICNKTRRK